MYAFPALTARIARAIKPFMMMPNSGRDLFVSLYTPEDCRSDLRMVLNRLPLNTLERPFFFQNSRRHSDFANIVQQPAQMSSLLSIFR